MSEGAMEKLTLFVGRAKELGLFRDLGINALLLVLSRLTEGVLHLGVMSSRAAGSAHQLLTGVHEFLPSVCALNPDRSHAWSTLAVSIMGVSRVRFTGAVHAPGLGGFAAGELVAVPVASGAKRDGGGFMEFSEGNRQEIDVDRVARQRLKALDGRARLVLKSNDD